MLRELMADNKAVVAAMRDCHEICDEHDDLATASLLENFIDQAERPQGRRYRPLTFMPGTRWSAGSATT